MVDKNKPSLSSLNQNESFLFDLHGSELILPSVYGLDEEVRASLKSLIQITTSLRKIYPTPTLLLLTFINYQNCHMNCPSFTKTTEVFQTRFRI